MRSFSYLLIFRLLSYFLLLFSQLSFSESCQNTFSNSKNYQNSSYTHIKTELAIPNIKQDFMIEELGFQKLTLNKKELSQLLKKHKIESLKNIPLHEEPKKSIKISSLSIDYLKAVLLLAKQNNRPAQLWLVKNYLKNFEQNSKNKKITNIFHKVMSAKTALNLLHLLAKIPFEKRNEQGITSEELASAKTLLGKIYYHGFFPTKNFKSNFHNERAQISPNKKLAISLFRDAITQPRSSLEAQFYLIKIFYNDKDIEKDLVVVLIFILRYIQIFEDNSLPHKDFNILFPNLKNLKEIKNYLKEQIKKEMNISNHLLEETINEGISDFTKFYPKIAVERINSNLTHSQFLLNMENN